MRHVKKIVEVGILAARISRVVADGGTWRLKWERLKAGESNGKLPPRTFPGCSVPEPSPAFNAEYIYIYIYSAVVSTYLHNNKNT